MSAAALPPAAPHPLPTWAAQLEPIELATSLTLLLVILHGGERWYLALPVLVIGVLAFAFPRLRSSDNLWFALTLVLGTANAFHWYKIDNHKFLITYWTFALTLALATPQPAAALARSARWMIGLCFAFATGWKVVSADFVSGDFFQFHLLFDPRFADLADWVAGVTPEMARHNQGALADLTDRAASLTAVTLRGTPALSTLANAMSAWTLFIEGALALAFLLPARTRLSRSRDLLLIAFVLSTYLLAPVMGFALVLLCMGAAQARSERARLGYALCFAFVQLYQAPWKGLVKMVAHTAGPT